MDRKIRFNHSEPDPSVSEGVGMWHVSYTTGAFWARWSGELSLRLAKVLDLIHGLLTIRLPASMIDMHVRINPGLLQFILPGHKVGEEIMPKIVDHADRRSVIVEKALEVFAQKGFHAANFLEIARACGLSRTVLYQYFSNKDEIFRAVVDHVVDTTTKNVMVIAQNKELSVQRKLQSICSVFTDVLGHSKYFIILLELVLYLKRKNTQVSEHLRISVRTLRSTIGELVTGLECGSSYACFATTMAFSFMESQIMQPILGDAAVDRRDMASLLKLLGSPKEDWPPVA